jgi:hypothetical protein
MPHNYYTKTWKNPTGKRELNWSCGTTVDQVFNLETLQVTQPFNISSTRIGFMLSFLDGLQKVLIFVDKLESINDEASGFKEVKGVEYILDLNSLSLSLVDNLKKIEILYASITSSGISWSERIAKKSKAFKPFSNVKIDKIEQAYQKYMATRGETSSLMNSSLARSFESQTALAAAEFSYKTIQLDDDDAV